MKKNKIPIIKQMVEEQKQAMSKLLMVEIGRKIINELQTKHPNLGKPYIGKLKEAFNEYVKHFIEDDRQYIKQNKLDGEEELDDEIMHIECFLNWLEKESNYKITVTKKVKKK